MANKSHSQAWTIGKANRSHMNHSMNVGPGQYEPSLTTKKNEPKWTMGSRTLQNLNKTVGPSPFAYDLPSKIVENSGKTFGTKNQ